LPCFAEHEAQAVVAFGEFSEVGVHLGELFGDPLPVGNHLPVQVNDAGHVSAGLQQVEQPPLGSREIIGKANLVGKIDHQLFLDCQGAAVRLRGLLGLARA
jgi:hypothetical protein